MNPSPALAWVVGQSGLLGQHVAASISRDWPECQLWREAPPLPWGSERILGALEGASQAFGAAAKGREWCLLWCAGSGVVGSGPEELSRETGALEALLSRTLDLLGSRPGRIFFSSSAGGLYADSAARPARESSPTAPLSPYGRAKQVQEELITRLLDKASPVSALIGRFSNLYGPGQRLDKRQGLISQLSRALIHRRPIHLYVPLDTVRDYLWVEDAARWVVRAMRKLGEARPATPVVKIFASEEETSIASVIATLGRITRRRALVVSGQDPRRGEQPRALQFRSEVWREVTAGPRTSLPAGLHRLHAHQMELYRKGRLPLELPG